MKKTLLLVLLFLCFWLNAGNIFTFLKINNAENPNFKNNIFSGKPRNAGAALIFKLPKKIEAGKNLAIIITFKDKVTASDFGMTLDSAQKRLNSNAILDKSGKKLTFEFKNIPIESHSIRLYFNRKKRFTNCNVQFEIINMDFQSFIHKKNETVGKIPYKARKRLSNEISIFPRCQNQYDLTINYLDFYHKGSYTFNDRPLFFDRSLAEKPLPIYNKFSSPKGFVRDLKSAKDFTTGLGLFLNVNRPLRFILPLRYATNQGMAGSILIETGAAIGNPDNFGKMEESLTEALSSDTPFRIKGKIVLSSYGGDKYTPEQWRKFKKYIEDKFPGKFLITCEMRSLAYRLNGDYKKNGNRVSAELISECKKRVRSYLRIIDGVNFSGSNHIIREAAGYPEQVFNNCVYENIIVPCLLSVMAEDEFNGKKILGLSAHKVYCQVRKTTSNTDEEGTGALRKSFFAALKANPDYIVMPEWNEVNENTHIQPVVSDSQTNRRVINAIMKKNTPSLETIFPNLILSFRQENDIAQGIPIELLGIPDEKWKPFSAVIKLYSPEGKLVETLPECQFNTKELQPYNFMLDAVKFAKYRYLTVELLINNSLSIKSGLPHIRLTTPGNIYHRYVKIPLRDLPNPQNIQIEIKFDKGKVIASGNIHSIDPLVSVELMANDVPLSAVDLRNEYQAPKGFKLFSLQVLSPGMSYYRNKKITLSPVFGKILPRTPHQMAMSGMPVPQIKDGRLIGSLCLWTHQEFLFFAEANTIAEVEYNGHKTQVNLADILKNGRFRESLPEGVSWRIISLEDELPEVPLALEKKELQFVLEAPYSRRINPVYYVRIVTKSGRVFRSLPVSQIETDSKIVKMPLWLLSMDKKISIDVPENLAKKIVYDFQPYAGKILPALNGTIDYDILIGSYDYWTHRSNNAWNFPTAPAWIKENGRWLLNFKTGDYMLINPLIFSKSAFTVEMDIAFDSLDHQTLLFVNNDELSIILAGERIYGKIKTRKTMKKFEAPVKIKPHKFYHFTMGYDLERFTVSIDGKQVVNVPISGRFNNGWLMTVGGCPVEKDELLSPKERIHRLQLLKEKKADIAYNLNAKIKSFSISNY